MDIVLLIKSIVGLVAVLALLLFLFIYLQKSNKSVKKEPLPEPVQHTPKHDWATLFEIFQNKKSTAKELEDAIDLLLKYHESIPKKLGLRTHPEFDKHSDIMLYLCRHPNTNKDLIIKLDRGLEKKNPEYNREINDALTKGLNSRGV